MTPPAILVAGMVAMVCAASACAAGAGDLPAGDVVSLDASTQVDADVLPDGAVPEPSDAPAATECPAEVASWPGVSILEDGRYRHVRGLGAPGLGARDVTVWLPPGYADDASARYPVLYMHDGQNLFFPEASAYGAWEVDEAVDALVAAGVIAPVIVVGIHHGADRIGDYTPTVDAAYGGGGADRYADYVATVVKPAVDGLFRTRCERSATAVMGSSLGGLVSLYIATRHPATFGRVGAVSPSLWWDDEALLEAFDAYDGRLPDRLWIDMGTAEGEGPGESASVAVRRVRRARDRALDRGMALGDALGYLEAHGGRHDEASWRARLPAILTFLFGPRPAPAVDGLRLRTLAPALYVSRRERTEGGIEARRGAFERFSIPSRDVAWEGVGEAISVASDGMIAANAPGAAVITARWGGRVVTEPFIVYGADRAPVRVVVEAPPWTPAGAAIHVAGGDPELGAWEPAGVRLAARSDGRHAAELPMPAQGSVAYKFTRGTWGTVEVAADGRDIDDRVYTPDLGDEVGHAVEQWRDMR